MVNGITTVWLPGSQGKERSEAHTASAGGSVFSPELSDPNATFKAYAWGGDPFFPLAKGKKDLVCTSFPLQQCPEIDEESEGLFLTCASSHIITGEWES